MRSFALLLCVLTLAACGRQDDDLRRYISETKARPGQPLEPIPQVRPYEAFAYHAGDRRDPFIKIEPELVERDTTGESSIRPDLQRNAEPLEAYPLDALRMVGTITTSSANFALVRAPDNVVHRVRLGNHLGQNFGRINQITEIEVSVIEIVPDGFGGWMERPASIPLTE
jgi:type IV pilus assembly protein PilP